MDKNLKNFTAPQFKELAQAYGQPPYSADYLFGFIHQRHISKIDLISPLSKAFRQKLQEDGFFISELPLVDMLADPDGTVKLVFMLSEGQKIEAVALTDDGRRTVCLSTQAGCRMGCAFCATGRLGFSRNLSVAEIVDQVYQAQKQVGKIHNLVYMGMGEPLDNLDNVRRSMEILHHPKGLNIGIRHITISTCGLPDAIRQMALWELAPRLALSLHAPDDATRCKLMRIGKNIPIADLLAALQDYHRATGRRVTIEYCLIHGVNDQPQQARQLAARLASLRCNVNLIELNPFAGCPFEPSPPAAIRRFADILQRAGIETVIRFRRGRAIKAACGQLGATQIEPPVAAVEGV